MKWIDYREKLGICWDDDQKTVALQKKVALTVENIFNQLNRYGVHGYDDVLADYFFTVAENPVNKTWDRLCKSIVNIQSVPEIISRYVVFCNSIAYHLFKDYAHEIRGILFTALSDLNIQYECIEDEDGIFIFPKGAPELDEALVSAPLEWLNDYPESRKAWIKALKEYADQTDENASDIADKFRKSLEIFLKEFFHIDKDMNELKRLYGNHLKSQGIPGEVQNGLDRILDCYDKFMNKYAKHSDRTSRKVLEYIMYETGNVMRLLITLKQEETSDAD